MTILVIHGPNLNMLGKRDQTQYGSKTLYEIVSLIDEEAKQKGVELRSFQSNHEGALVDFLQENAGNADGIIINPGALTHYGYSLRDAIVDTRLPVVEVHLSDIENREDFRKIDVLDGRVVAKIVGKKEQGYVEALQTLLPHIQS